MRSWGAGDALVGFSSYYTHFLEKQVTVYPEKDNFGEMCSFCAGGITRAWYFLPLGRSSFWHWARYSGENEVMKWALFFLFCNTKHIYLL